MSDVKVEFRHIAAGKRNDMGGCPIALALHEAGFVSAEVDCHVIVFYSGSMVIKDSPISAAILRYDKFGVMSPFEFDVVLEGN